VVRPGLDHPVHHMPLFIEGVELQDVIVVGGTVSTACHNDSVVDVGPTESLARRSELSSVDPG